MAKTISFNTKIHLNNKQQSAFHQWAGMRRYAFNFCLALCIIYLEIIKNTGKKNQLLSEIYNFDKFFNAGKYPLCFERKQKGAPLIGTGLNEWARLAPSSIGQIAIKYDLKDGWKRCFNKLGKSPHYQSRRRHSSFTLSSADLKPEFIRGKNLTLPKNLGLARLGDAIPYAEYALGNTTFSKKGANWYVSFCLTIPNELYYREIQKRKSEVGIDVGVNVYAATSDGIKYYAPNKLNHLQKRKDAINHKISRILHKNFMSVVCDCKRCSKLVKGISDTKKLCHSCKNKIKPFYSSRKIKKLRQSVSIISVKQQQIRISMCHQLTTNLVKNYDSIYIENLKIKHMTKSAAGDKETPGKNVKQKSGLNRSFLNIAPYRFRTMLEYKCDKFVNTLNLVNPSGTSQTCSECGYKSPGNRKNLKFKCLRCGYEEHADINAAINILNKGRK